VTLLFSKQLLFDMLISLLEPQDFVNLQYLSNDFYKFYMSFLKDIKILRPNLLYYAYEIQKELSRFKVKSNLEFLFFLPQDIEYFTVRHKTGNIILSILLENGKFLIFEKSRVTLLFVLEIEE
jgi:hypothetical protein